MKTIYKEVIHPNSARGDVYRCEFIAPKGARPVSVGKQGDNVCVWFECSIGNTFEPIAVYCVGTGLGRVPDDCRFLGTVVDGNFVWHFYSPVL